MTKGEVTCTENSWRKTIYIAVTIFNKLLMSEKLEKMNLLNFSVWNLILAISYVVTVISGETFNSDVTFVRKEKAETKDNNNIIDVSKRCSSTRNTEALLSRKKRGLSFPDGSFFVVSNNLRFFLLTRYNMFLLTILVDLNYKTLYYTIYLFKLS